MQRSSRIHWNIQYVIFRAEVDEQKVKKREKIIGKVFEGKYMRIIIFGKL